MAQRVDLARDVVGLPARHVDQVRAGQAPHPRLLAFGELPRARDRAGDVAGEQFGESDGGASSRARTGGVGGADLVDRAGVDHRGEPLRRALAKRGPVHPEADEEGRLAHLTRPELLAAGDLRERATDREQLVRADDARGVGRLHGRGSIGIAGGELGVQRGKATGLGRARQQRLADAGGRRRGEREVGERSAEVEPGAADDDRRAARCERGIDLVMREGGVLGHRPGAVDRQEPDEPVLERRLFACRGLGGDQRQAGVHLERVDADRDRILPALPKLLREGDRHGGLADRRGPEDRKDGRWHRPSIAPAADARRAGSRSGTVAPMQLRDSKVLITGATGGLGAAMARALKARGAQLVLTGRNRALLDPLAEELGAVAAPCDLTDRVALRALLTEHGDVDVLIANAAVPGSGLLESFTEEELDRIVEANLTAPIQMARALVPGMVERGRGHLVFMSSLGGKVASPGASMYAATKFGVRGFAFGLRQDLEKTGVGVSVISPGFIRDAGMFAKSGVEGSLPPGVGTSSPQQVVEATINAIERDLFEVTVAPLPMRVGATFGLAFPRAAAVTQKLSGAKGIAERLAEGQASYRV